ncbi:MAG: hypothetical protein AB1938_32315 [Myxococcota bacterium]
MVLPPDMPMEDAAAMAVVADWLTERGDPRGELMQLQLHLEEAPDDARLRQAEALHLARHARALLGPLALHQTVCQLTWRRGFVVEARLTSLAREPWDRERVEPTNRLERAAHALTQLPRADTVRAVTLEQPWSWFVGRHFEAAARALRRGGLRLARLTVVVPWVDGGWGEEAALFTPDAGVVELEHGSLLLTCDARVVAQVERALWR